MNTTLDRLERQTFRFDASDYFGDKLLSTVIRELVEDWGTGLNASLYRQAILSCVCGAVESEQLLPMTSGGQFVGNQRFHLLSSDTALGVTTYSNASDTNLREFKQLIAVSPLKQLHWLNIYHHHVRLVTVCK